MNKIFKKLISGIGEMCTQFLPLSFFRTHLVILFEPFSLSLSLSLSPFFFISPLWQSWEAIYFKLFHVKVDGGTNKKVCNFFVIFL